MRIILDIKTPGSGEVEANVWGNLRRLKPTDEVKFVVCDRDDFDWSVEVVRRHRLVGGAARSCSARVRSVNPTELADYDPRIPAAGPAPAPAAQDSLGPGRPRGLKLPPGERLRSERGVMREGRRRPSPQARYAMLPAERRALADPVLKGQEHGDIAGNAQNHL